MIITLPVTISAIKFNPKFRDQKEELLDSWIEFMSMNYRYLYLRNI